jgi:hypothetical protein
MSMIVGDEEGTWEKGEIDHCLGLQDKFNEQV